MATRDRRPAAATATVGAGATFGGGVLRHKGIRAAHEGEDAPPFKWRHPIATHQTRALLRPAARGRNRYLLGATLGLVGAPALAVGGHDYFRKAQQKHGFIAEGLHGTQDALHQRAEGLKETPPGARVGPLAVGAGAGAAGSWGGHLALNRFKAFRGGRNHALRAGVTALTGATAAAASLPIARHAVRSSEYEVTPAGVRRRKRAPVRPSSKAKVFDQKQMSRRAFRNATVGSASKRYLGQGAWSMPKHMSRGVLQPSHRLNMRVVNNQMATEQHFGQMKRNNKATRMHSGRLAETRATDPSTVYQRLRKSERRLTLQRITQDSDHWAAESLRKPMDDPGGYKALEAIRMHTASERARRAKRDARGRFTKAAPTPQRAHELALGFARKGKLVEQKRALELRNRLIGKADYPGRHVSPHEQRAKIMAAGAIPGIPFAGPAAAAHVAGSYAPPGEKRKAQARQLGSSVATTATGVGGAYLAAGNRRAGEQALRLHHGMQRAGERLTRPVRSRVHLKSPGGNRIAEVKSRGSARAQQTLARSSKLRRAVRPLAANKPAAVAGYIAGAKLTGMAYQNLAISRNQAAQRRYNLKHPNVKKLDATGMNRREQQKLIERKRRSAATSVVTGSLGLAGAGMGAALLPGVRGRLKPKHVQTLERAAIGTGLAAGGVSGVHSIRSARLQRHELDAQERALASKADSRPLTRMREDQAHQIVRRYGNAGPLPKELSREDRMRAYEARYVHAGGHKAEHWQRRADVADKIKTGGLAGATAAGAGILALRHPRIARAMGHRVETARHAADSAAIGAATASGAAELYAGHARRRRSSYSNSKAGVAASALRRMKDYSS